MTSPPCSVSASPTCGWRLRVCCARDGWRGRCCWRSSWSTSGWIASVAGSCVLELTVASLPRPWLGHQSLGTGDGEANRPTTHAEWLRGALGRWESQFSNGLSRSARRLSIGFVRLVCCGLKAVRAEASVDGAVARSRSRGRRRLAREANWKCHRVADSYAVCRPETTRTRRVQRKLLHIKYPDILTASYQQLVDE